MDKTAVGKRGTSPVSRKVRKMGHARMTAITVSNAAVSEKDSKGRSSFTSLPIMNRMRKPSLKVESLLTEPGGRSL